MMVMAAPGSSWLQPLLSALQSKTAQTDDRVQAYTKICSSLLDGGEECILEELCELAGEIIKVISISTKSGQVELAQGAAQALGLCLQNVAFCKALNAEDQELVLKVITGCIGKDKDKVMMTRALWCLSKQQLPATPVIKELETILAALETAFEISSLTVEFEALNCLSRLQEMAPEEMKEHAATWLKFLVLPMASSSAEKIRTAGLTLFENNLDLATAHQPILAKYILTKLKPKLAPELQKLMAAKEDMYLLRIWKHYIRTLGKSLHHGPAINQLLVFVEHGFKHPSPDVKLDAFHAWRVLMDNFALCHDVISDQRRVKLIMQVFRINNAKTEELAKEKFNTWWHFVCKLQDKASKYFDQVCIPLLVFCFGASHGMVVGTPSVTRTQNPSGAATPKLNKIVPGAMASPATPKMSLPGTVGTQCAYKSVQLLGVQALAQMLGMSSDGVDLPPVNFSIEKIDCDIITGVTFFMKQATPLMFAIQETLSSFSDIDDGMFQHIMYRLVALMNSCLESGPKRDVVEVFTIFMSALQNILGSSTLQPARIVKLFQAVMCLPAKVFGSSVYHPGNAGVMQGCPALVIIELLVQSGILQNPSTKEGFFSLLGQAIEAGMSHMGKTLSFCQSVLQILDQASADIKDPDSAWRAWALVVHPLHEDIIKTNEVNQGDALEHNFGCLVTALTLPVARILPHELSQASQKSVLKTWTDLYSTFARLAALVFNAAPNSSCSEVCCKMVDITSDEELKVFSFLDGLSQMLWTILDKFDFSALSTATTFNFNSPNSPVRFSRKQQQHPLGSLHYAVKLIAMLVRGLVQAEKPAEGLFQKQKHVTQASWQSALTHAIQALTTLFSHVSSQTMITQLFSKLAEPVSQLYVKSSKRAGSWITEQLLQKLDKLWLDITTCLQGRHKGPYDTDLLKAMSPLWEATFLHPRRQIKNQTSMVWNATFGQASLLVYPENLKTVLAQVKQKSTLRLPSWESSLVSEIDDTPVSQMSMGGTQPSLPPIVGLASPHKAVGSFLNKVASPSIKKSPLKQMKSPPQPNSARKKLSLSVNDMRDDEFVVIKPNTRKRRVLTEHQKEVMKDQKRSGGIPALYNNLDASQDVSMSSFFSMDTQMSQMSQKVSSPADTPVEIRPFAFASKRQKLDDNKEAATEVIIEKETISLLSESNDTDEEKKKKTSSLKTNGSRSLRSKKPSVQFADQVQDDKPVVISSESPEAEDGKTKITENNMERNNIESKRRNRKQVNDSSKESNTNVNNSKSKDEEDSSKVTNSQEPQPSSSPAKQKGASMKRSGSFTRSRSPRKGRSEAKDGSIVKFLITSQKEVSGSGSSEEALESSAKTIEETQPFTPPDNKNKIDASVIVEDTELFSPSQREKMEPGNESIEETPERKPEETEVQRNVTETCSELSKELFRSKAKESDVKETEVTEAQEKIPKITKSDEILSASLENVDRKTDGALPVAEMSTPTKERIEQPRPFGTPVLKLHKLTKEEIAHYSPSKGTSSKQEASDIISQSDNCNMSTATVEDKTPKGRRLRRRPSLIKLKESSKTQQPISMGLDVDDQDDGIIPSSQGSSLSCPSPSHLLQQLDDGGPAASSKSQETEPEEMEVDNLDSSSSLIKRDHAVDDVDAMLMQSPTIKPLSQTSVSPSSPAVCLNTNTLEFSDTPRRRSIRKKQRKRCDCKLGDPDHNCLDVNFSSDKTDSQNTETEEDETNTQSQNTIESYKPAGSTLESNSETQAVVTKTRPRRSLSRQQQQDRPETSKSSLKENKRGRKSVPEDGELEKESQDQDVIIGAMENKTDAPECVIIDSDNDEPLAAIADDKTETRLTEREKETNKSRTIQKTGRKGKSDSQIDSKTIPTPASDQSGITSQKEGTQTAKKEKSKGKDISEEDKVTQSSGSRKLRNKVETTSISKKNTNTGKDTNSGDVRNKLENASAKSSSSQITDENRKSLKKVDYKNKGTVEVKSLQEKESENKQTNTEVGMSCDQSSSEKNNKVESASVSENKKDKSPEQPKRKRGRPKKHSTDNKQLTKKEKETEDSEVQKKDGSSLESQQYEVTLGLPHSSLSVQEERQMESEVSKTGEAKYSSQNNNQVESSSVPENKKIGAQAQPKSKRGRPKKQASESKQVTKREKESEDTEVQKKDISSLENYDSDLTPSLPHSSPSVKEEGQVDAEISKTEVAESQENEEDSKSKHGRPKKTKVENKQENKKGYEEEGRKQEDAQEEEKQKEEEEKDEKGEEDDQELDSSAFERSVEDSDSEDDVPLLLLHRPEIEEEALKDKNPSNSSEEVVKKEAEEVKPSENNVNAEMDMDSCADMFDSMKTSTPLKPMPSVAAKPKDQVTQLPKGRKIILARRRNSSGSPMSGRLRSGRMQLRTKAVNKSFDSTLSLKSVRNKECENKINQVVVEKDGKAELEEQAKMEVDSQDIDAEKEVEKCLDEHPVEEQAKLNSEINTGKTVTDSETEKPAPIAQESENTNESSRSPETPKSAKKYLSRAAAILQQAKTYRAVKPAAVSAQTTASQYKAMAKKLAKYHLVSPHTSRARAILEKSLKIGNKSPEKSSGPLVFAKPVSPKFRPVHIPRVYSPSASPSAGILKRRRLSGLMETSSPSPPNKQRRVSFAEAIQVCEATTSRPVSRCLHLPRTVTPSPLTVSSDDQVSEKENEKTNVPTEEAVTDDMEMVEKETELEPSLTPSLLSLGTYSQTPESQLDCQEPICPELIECDWSVTEILPQLTTSTWMQGLEKLLESKDIKTIGQLVSLSVYEINLFPIHVPKEATVKKALQTVREKWFNQPQEKTEPELVLQNEPLPSVEEELAKLSPQKDMPGACVDDSFDAGTNLVLEESVSEATCQDAADEKEDATEILDASLKENIPPSEESIFTCDKENIPVFSADLTPAPCENTSESSQTAVPPKDDINVVDDNECDEKSEDGKATDSNDMSENVPTSDSVIETKDDSKSSADREDVITAAERETTCGDDEQNAMECQEATEPSDNNNTIEDKCMFSSGAIMENSPLVIKDPMLPTPALDSLVPGQQEVKDISDRLHSLADEMSQDTLLSMNSSQLVDIHMTLNSMMNKVVMALKSKCSSPSQSGLR